MNSSTAIAGEARRYQGAYWTAAIRPPLRRKRWFSLTSEVPNGTQFWAVFQGQFHQVAL